MQTVTVAVTDLSGNCLLAPPVPSLHPSTLHVWQFPLTTPEAGFFSFAELLSEDERTRASKFHFEKDARRFTVVRASVRSILAGYTGTPAGDICFVYAQHGKPSLADSAGNLHFNVSHAGELALLAVALGRPVGVDIEAMREGVEIEKLAERFFSARECESFLLLPPDQKLSAFFRYWTCKEAFLKAEGVGLSRSLDSFDVDLNMGRARLAATRPDASEADRWSLHELEPAPGYTGAVAVEGAITTISLFRYGRSQNLK